MVRGDMLVIAAGADVLPKPAAMHAIPLANPRRPVAT